MKEQEKAMARDLYKTDISNKPDRKVKAMIIRIPIGFEKRVDYMSETLNTDIRNNISEIKDSINEMRNMFNGMNNRLEKAEKKINDLVERVMGSNQGEQKKEKKKTM